MRLLALVTDAFGGRGGIAQYNRDFLSALADDWNIDVLPRHAPDPLTELPENLKQLSPRKGRIAYILEAIWQGMRQRPEMVFCGHLFMAPLALMVAKLSGAELIVQMHGIEAWDRPRRLSRWAIERSSGVLCVSRFTRHRVLGWAAIEPERVSVLPNTVGRQFSPGNRVAARQFFGLSMQKKVLLTVARLAASERYKGHDFVLESLPALIAAGHDVLYVIAGEGDDRPRLEELASRLGIARHVLFLGVVDDGALPDLYRAADVFVMPSTGEGFGIAFLEAMVCGVPALGLTVCGAKDPLESGDTGSAVTISEFRLKLITLLDHIKSTPGWQGNQVDAGQVRNAVAGRFGRNSFSVRAKSLVRSTKGWNSQT